MDYSKIPNRVTVTESAYGNMSPRYEIHELRIDFARVIDGSSSGRGDLRTVEQAKAIAEELAKRWNSHDALVHALGEMLVCFDDGVGVPHTERVLDDARKLFHEVGGDMVAVMSSAADLKGV